MYLELDQADIYYETYGEGKPLLMIHGNWCDLNLMKGCMERVFEKTEKPDLKNFRRIYIDLPGMGNTVLKKDIHTTDDIFNILKKAVDNLIQEPLFYIASESYGSYLARAFIKKEADRIGGLMMICPVTVPEFEKREIPGHRVIERDIDLYSRLSENDKKNCNYVLTIQTEKVWNRYIKEVRSGVRKSNITLLKKIKREGYSFRDNIDRLDKPFEKPVLILLGMQDQSVGYRDALNIIDNFSEADCIISGKAGHMLQIEQEELFTFHTEKWLERIQSV